MFRLTWLAIALLTICSPAEAGNYEHARNGFMIGFGIGGGSLGIEGGDSREGGGTGNFRIGFAATPQIVLHLESNAWRKTFSEQGVDVTTTFSNAIAAVTWYSPQGIFLRGGFGFARLVAEAEADGITVSADDNGIGLLIAWGYEFRLSRKFALAPQIEYAYQNFNDGTTNLIAGGLGFNWYW